MRGLRALILAGICAASCSSDPEPKAATPANAKLADRQELLDARFCDPCHHDHYTEWQGSMHAFAADDPLFRALNQKMQAESPPEQRDFCLRCHAPMAVESGASLDLASLDARPELKGVTCIFCHSVERSTGSSNNPLVLHDGATLFGGITDPIDPGVHEAKYSFLLDSKSDGSPGLCGPCHDIVTVRGAHIERTFREWATSRFGVAEQTKTSCGACHMPTREGPAAGLPRAPTRTLHDHSLAGVDLALSPFPAKDDQRARVQRFLDDAISTRLCVTPDGAGGATVDVDVRNEKVGHRWPSGSAQDRRAWLDVVATKADATIFASGQIADGVSVASAADPDLFLLRDHDLDADGKETELFWRAASYTSQQLPAPAPGATAPEPTLRASYRLAAMPDRVHVVMKIRPVDYELLEAAGVDRAGLDPITTFRVAATERTWTAGGGACVP